jgi:lambda family phage holin
MVPDRFDTWAMVVAWLNQRMPILTAALIAASIAGLNAIYRGSGGRRIFLEALILAVVAGTVFPVLEHFGLSPALANPIAAVIGLVGLEGIRARARRYLGITIDKPKE